MLTILGFSVQTFTSNCVCLPLNGTNPPQIRDGISSTCISRCTGSSFCFLHYTMGCIPAGMQPLRSPALKPPPSSVDVFYMESCLHRTGVGDKLTCERRQRGVRPGETGRLPASDQALPVAGSTAAEAKRDLV